MRRALEVGAATGLLLLLIIVLGLSTGIISLNLPGANAQATPAPSISIDGGGDSVPTIAMPTHVGGNLFQLDLHDSLPSAVLHSDQDCAAAWKQSIAKFSEDHEIVYVFPSLYESEVTLIIVKPKE